MDPLTAFALFIAGQAVLPDAYTRGVDWVLHRSNAERLAKDVKKLTGHRTGHYYRQWYEREETWNLLIAQGQAAYESLVDSLDTALTRRLWGKPDKATVEEVVQATIGLFVSSLEPSEAVAVEGQRSAVRDVTHDNAEAARHERTLGEVRGVAQRLDADAELPERVQYLPPGPRLRLLEAPDRPTAMRLLDLVDIEDPRPAVAALVRPVPDWLAQASPVLVLAAAELALAYQVQIATQDLFELAAGLGIERGYCTARLALHHDLGEEAAALALLDSLPEPRGIYADSTAAVLSGDFERFTALVTADAATSDALLTSLWLHYLRKTDAPIEDVITFLADAVQRQTEAPGLLLALAELHHQRSKQPSATSRPGDRARARDLLLEARDLRRRWRADSAEAVAAACRLALAHGDPRRAIALGSEPPRGEAQPKEAADTEVRNAVGVAHAGLGNIEDATSAIEPAAGDFLAAILQADVLGRAKADAATVAAAYETAWHLATNEMDKTRVWLGSAAAGVPTPPGADELAQQPAQFQALVAAQLALSTERPADAVLALRPYPMEELHVTMLAHALADLGEVDEAVAVLRSASDRFNDPTEHLVDAARILRRADRNADAAQLAADALRVVPASETDARDYLHEVGAAEAWSAQTWGEAARRLRAWIGDLGPTPHRRWALASALHNSGDPAAAWAAIREAPALEPSDAGEAQLWIVLAADQSPGPETAKRMLALVDQFPDEPEVAQKFVGCFLMMRDERGDVDPVVVQRFQALLEEHAVEHDGGTDMSGPLLKISGTPEQMIDQMQPHLEARAKAIQEMVETVRDGYPYGMVTLVAGRTYTSALVQRAAGVLPIATNDTDRAAAERDAARAALASRSVVIDTSTLVIASYVRGMWPVLRDRFRLEMPSPARYDILRAEDELTDTRASGSVYFDTDAGAVRVSEADPAVVAQLSDTACWITGELPHVTVRDWPRLLGDAHEDREDIEDDAFLSWMSGMDMARARSLPLWADDLGLRTLAANEGVAAFGTVALLEVLHEDGELTDGQLVTVLRTLRQQYVVDLPLDSEWAYLSASADAWAPGPACAFFLRPASWADFEATMSAWNDIAQDAAVDEPAKVVPWVVHAAHGLVRAARPGLEHQVVALFAAKGIAYARFDPDVTATLVRVARQVCAKYGHPNPVPLVLSSLHTRLSEALSTHGAAQFMMNACANLAEEDLASLRSVVLGVDEGDTPPSTQ
jgi:hypothetical protein